ncbi:N-6 DNA methylase [Candidatus Hodarchaeum mangrovi]
MVDQGKQKLHSFLGIKITPSNLEQHIWDSLKFLKGFENKKESKHLIIGLLFLKRLNDLFSEVEREKKKSGDTSPAWGNIAGIDFYIPPEARWRRLRKRDTNLGSFLNKSCKIIEDNNESLKNILTIFNFDIKVKKIDRILLNLINHFDAFSLGNQDLENPSVLGQVYRNLLVKFEESIGTKNSSLTPPTVNDLLVKLLNPKEGEWICDPALGVAGTLFQCIEYIKAEGGKTEGLHLYGQEKDLETFALAKIHLLLDNMHTIRIEKGNSLFDPKFMQGDQLLEFDLVLTHPPFRIGGSWQQLASEDPFERFQFGIPSSHYGNLMFLQHLLAILRPNGRLGAVFPPGVLFRGGEERKIRKKLVEQDLIEAIIGLPPNLFYDSKVAACILILSKSKLKERKGKILFIDAFNDVIESNPQNFLSQHSIEKIVSTFKQFRTIKDYSQLVTIKEIINYSFNLNIPLYIEKSLQDEIIDLSLSKANLLHLEMERSHLSQEVINVLSELDSFKEPEEGNLPATWYSLNLGEMIELQDGKTVKLSKNGNIAIISEKKFGEFGTVKWDSLDFTTQDGLEDNTKGQVHLHDILVSKSGETTGNTVFIKELPYKQLYANEKILIVRTKDPNKLEQKYLFYLLSSALVQDQIKKRFSGGSHGINPVDFKTIRIPIPPLSEQKRITKILSVVNQTLITTKNISTETEKLTIGLMQQLLTGKIQLQ